MHAAIQDIESLLQQHKQTLRNARRSVMPADLTTRLSLWTDRSVPALMAVTISALLVFAVGLASAAFAFMPVNTAANTTIQKTDRLRALTPEEMTDRGYSRLKDKFCQAAFNGNVSTADRGERNDARLKMEDESSTAGFTSPPDTRTEKRQRKSESGNRTRYRTSGSTQDQARKQPSLFERFTGVRL